MLNWLITGASGFVGRALLEELSKIRFELDNDKEINLLGVCRSVPKKPLDRVRYLEVGDLVSGVGIIDRGGFLNGVDVVVHAAARVHVIHDKSKKKLEDFRRVNVDATLELARRVASSGVKRFIFISSVGVNGKSTTSELAFTELSTPNPHNEYSQSKYEAEQGLCVISRETGLEVVIIRPPLVYGVSAPGNFASLIKAVNMGLPLPLGSVLNRRSFIFLGNFVNFIILCGTDIRAANHTFLISDGSDISTADLIKKISKASGKSDRLWNFNISFLKAVAALTGKSEDFERICGNLQVDISKAKDLLGWVPPYSVDEGIKISVQGANN